MVDVKFADVRKLHAETNPRWRLAESVVSVPAQAVADLFTDGTKMEAVDAQQ